MEEALGGSMRSMMALEAARISESYRFLLAFCLLLNSVQYRSMKALEVARIGEVIGVILLYCFILVLKTLAALICSSGLYLVVH